MLEIQDLIDFSIVSWYEDFKDIALHAEFIELPQNVLDKIRSDSTDLEVIEECPHDFLHKINQTIKSFENSLGFVKNNWNAPKDAKFLLNTLRVSNIFDVFLFLSNSEIIMHDFSNEKYNDFYLVFKPWVNIHPATEFRCIVINNILRGITPRDWPVYYAHFNDEGPGIIHKLSMFFHQNIKGKFKRHNFTFDVILNYPNDIVLLDIGPLNTKSELYAFTWKEVQSILVSNSTQEIAPVFRYLAQDMGLMTRSKALFKIQQARDE